MRDFVGLIAMRQRLTTPGGVFAGIAQRTSALMRRRVKRGTRSSVQAKRAASGGRTQDVVENAPTWRVLLSTLILATGLFSGTVTASNYEQADASSTLYWSYDWGFIDTSESQLWADEIGAFHGNSPCNTYWAGGGPYDGGTNPGLPGNVMQDPHFASFVAAHPYPSTPTIVGRAALRPFLQDVNVTGPPQKCLPANPNSPSLAEMMTVQLRACSQGFAVTPPPAYGAQNVPPGALPSCQKSSGDYPDPNKERGGFCAAGQAACGNPINPVTGNKYEIVTDYRGSGAFPIVLTRTYNSLGVSGWIWNVQRSVSSVVFENGFQGVLLTRPDGRQVWFDNSSGAYKADADVIGVLTQLPNNAGWTFVNEADETETYDPRGGLIAITTRAGLSQTFTRDPVTENLLSISDQFGHQLTFQSNNQFTDAAGNIYQYAFDAQGRLTSVTYPDGTSRQYIYGELANTANVNRPLLLTGIIDENNVRYSTFKYESHGFANHTEHTGGVEAYDVAYSLYAGDLIAATVTAPLGASSSVAMASTQRVNRLTNASGMLCSGCGFDANGATYDANGNRASKSDYAGNQTNYVYDLTRNLETSRTEAAGTAVARTITTSWNASYRLPATVTEPNRTTSYTYDGSGNVLTRTITDTSVTPNVARTWTYTYNAYGQILSADGPRTDVSDVTTYTYYSCTTGYQCGQLQTVTNALGQTTTYNTYNAHGQPLTITDANGVVTTLTYDARLRVNSRTIGSEVTTFSYWPTGKLKQVTLPDTSYVFYQYDNAQRLTQISDRLGNAIDYTLDAMGNRVAENTYDPSNVLHRTHTRVFNALSQLYQDINAANTAAVTTTFTYSNDGNPTRINAPLSRLTVNAYDALNRLNQITDPAYGVTQLGYDGNDNLTQVTDPRSLVTNYTYTGFGDLKTQTSPDTGVTTNTYDSGGNLATSTDARGAVATYAYDALNRVTSTAFARNGTTDQTLTFSYDAGTNGKGRLTGAADASHSLGWTYDPLGRVTLKSQTIGAVSKSIGYTYTNGNLTGLTTPSGQTIAYGYNNNHQITSVTVNGTTILSNVGYEPLGPVNGWTWGNGTTVARTFDTDGKIAQLSSAGTKGYSYDNAFRITGITDTAAGSANWTYGYDVLDRLTSGAAGSTTKGWTYDASGNRLSETGSTPTTYNVSATSNLIASTTGSLARTYAYDAAGNVASYVSVTTSYNNRGRLAALTQSGATSTYLYNALGQRIQQSGGAQGTVLYWYDEAGRLVGEYDGSGNLIEETVWLGDIPVATLRPGSPVAIYYVHTDHLNTPRQVTRPSDNAQLWTWFSDPFGTNLPNENPAGVGTFKYYLRFPGQVFDGAAGLHQNTLRDYDPGIGKYVEPDPIGLRGGINDYTYVRSAPFQRIDPFGLSAADVQAIQNYARAWTASQTASQWRIDPGWKNDTCFVARVFGAGYCRKDKEPYDGCKAQSAFLLNAINNAIKNGDLKLDDQWQFTQQFYLPFLWQVDAVSSNPNDPALGLNPFDNTFGPR